MDYLYRTIQKEMGLQPQEPSAGEELATSASEVPVVPREAVPEARIGNVRPFPAIVREDSTRKEPACESSVQKALVQRVQFPVKTEQLFCLRSTGMNREQRHALEQYRVLRSRVIELTNDQRIRSLMLTSALAGEQKTTTSINLALAISQVQGMRVCLVDADMRKAGVADALGITFEKGLQDLLRGDVPVHEAMLQLTDSLFLIPSSDADLSSADALHSVAMTSLLQSLRDSFDIVIFDAPPLFPVADARILANIVDGALLCVRAGDTSGTVVQEAVELIRPRLLGAILVDTEVRTSPYYYYESKPGLQE